MQHRCFNLLARRTNSLGTVLLCSALKAMIRNSKVLKFEGTYDVISRDIITSATRNFAQSCALIVATLVQNYRPIGNICRKLKAKNLYFLPIFAIFWTKKYFLALKSEENQNSGSVVHFEPRF